MPCITVIMNLNNNDNDNDSESHQAQNTVEHTEVKQKGLDKRGNKRSDMVLHILQKTPV